MALSTEKIELEKYEEVINKEEKIEAKLDKYKEENYKEANIKAIDNLESMFKFRKYDYNIYVYIRISTNKQFIYTQLFELKNFCIKERLYPHPKNIIIDINISGKIEWRERKIKIIMDKVKKNDLIIVPEISRIGRNMNEVQEIMAICVKNNVKIRDIKNIFTLDGSLQSNMMASLYAMFTQMERQLISDRVKQGMAAMKAKGIPLKRGIRHNKLDGKETFIINALQNNILLAHTARELNVDRTQLVKFIKDKNLRNQSSNI
jgi:DNA invertase Pin-like site-specific DNA recombinase